MANTHEDEPARESESALVVNQDGGTTTIRINRPETLGALTPDHFDELDALLRTAAADRTQRAIVLTGTGKGFCTGIDVKGVAASDAAAGDAPLDPITASYENLHLRLSGVIRTIHALPIPVIAAVNGYAIGAGFAMAAACDLRVAGDRASFADGFVKRGISGCEMGLSYFLPRIMSPAMANELMLTGRRIDAAEALRIGLVSRVVDGDDLVVDAIALASEVAENAPMAVSMTKEVMWSNLHAASLDHALNLESRTQTLVRNTADASEARNAFLEKRPPVFGSSTVERLLR